MFNKQHSNRLRRDGCIEVAAYPPALGRQTARQSTVTLDWLESIRSTPASSAKPAAGTLRETAAGVTRVQRQLLVADP